MNSHRKSLVSVLLPSYNHEQYIQAAIESVYQQTYQNIELIVIDDGSTDKSVEILTNLQKKYGFVFLQQENQGLIATLEKLGGLAKGEYISLFSSDDVYHPEKIDVLVSYLENNKQLAMVYSKIGLINSQSQSIEVIDEPYQEGDIFFKLLCGEFFINGLATLVRSEVYFSHTRMNSYIDDFQFWLAIAKHHQIGFVDKVTAFYRIHNNHLSKNIIKMQKSENEILMQYAEDEGFSVVMDEWNLRWFRAFAPCYKTIAIQKFFIKVLMSRKILTLSFFKGVVRLFLPCRLK